MNYDDTNGINVYIDGQEKVTTQGNYVGRVIPSDGNVVVGRLYTNEDNHHGSLLMDELTFWNRKLEPQEIDNLNN